MNDKNGRQKLIEYVQLEIEHYTDGGNLTTEEKGIVKGLERLEAIIHDYEVEITQPPADHWIPCSEREPEDPCVYTVEDSSPYTVKKFGKPQRYVWKVLPYSLEMYHGLVAWKPVDPEPYKGE